MSAARHLYVPTLAESETWARSQIHGASPDHVLRPLCAEYRRRGKVEAAAAEFVMAGLCGDHPADQAQKLLALIAAVRTSGDFHG